MPESILVVDDDPDVAGFLETFLTSAGYDVAVASDGAEGLQRALEVRPDLIMLDVMMPNVDGFEFAQRIRRDPRTSSASIIMVTAKAQSSDKVLGLASGADDYVLKPFDSVELLARVVGTLRRAKEMRAASPLTGFPGNVRIQEEIQRRIAEREAFALLYVDLDNFKAYNDRYGFERGDGAIQSLAQASLALVQEVAGPTGFVGHVGGDDFVLIVGPDVGEQLADLLCRRFDAGVPALYDALDAKRGTVEIEDRQGVPRRYPLLSLSIGVVSTRKRGFSHYGEVVAVATEMKQQAKQQTGSTFKVDQRSDGGDSAAPAAIPN